MKKLRTAKETLYSLSNDMVHFIPGSHGEELAIKAMKQYAKEALEMAAEKAKVEQRKWRNELVGIEELWSYKENMYFVNKASILDLIKELD